MRKVPQFYSPLASYIASQFYYASHSFIAYGSFYPFYLTYSVKYRIIIGKIFYFIIGCEKYENRPINANGFI